MRSLNSGLVFLSLFLFLSFFFFFFFACMYPACFGLYHSFFCGWVTWHICTHVCAQVVHKDAMRGFQVSTTVYSPLKQGLSLTLVPWDPHVYISSSLVPDACSQAQMSHGCPDSGLHYCTSAISHISISSPIISSHQNRLNFLPFCTFELHPKLSHHRILRHTRVGQSSSKRSSFGSFPGPSTTRGDSLKPCMEISLRNHFYVWIPCLLSLILLPSSVYKLAFQYVSGHL